MSAYYDVSINQPLNWQVFVVPTGLSILCILIYLFTNFTVFHMVAEFFSIFVGITALTVAISSSQFTQNQFIIFLAIALGWCSMLDFIHVVLYEGMNVVHGQPVTESSQFWVSARFLQAVAFLISPIFFYRRYPISYINLALFIYTSICGLLIISDYFPTTYTPEHGITNFKFISELIIIFILLIACSIYHKYRNLMPRNLYIALIASMVMTIISEVSFSIYFNFISSDLIGHICKIFAYWFIYIALVTTTLHEPFSLLGRAASNYDAIPDPTIIINSKGIIYQANTAAAIMAGTTSEKLAGLSAHDMFHNPKAPPQDCPICQALKTEKYGIPISITRGQNSWVESKLSLIQSPFYKHAWIEVIRDMTAYKQLEQTKTQAIHNLNERIKELRCINTIFALSTQDNLNIPQLLQSTVDSMPAAFQYPEITSIIIKSHWGNFMKGSLSINPSSPLTSTILIEGSTVGNIEVVYSGGECSSQPSFLPEEQMLIEGIAHMLSNIINRLLTREKNRQLSYLYEMLSAISHAALRCHSKEELLAGLFEAMRKFAHLDRIIIAKSITSLPKYKILHSMAVATEKYEHLNRDITNFIDALDESSYGALLMGEVITPDQYLGWGDDHKKINTTVQEHTVEFIIPLLHDHHLIGIIYTNGLTHHISKHEMEKLLNELSADASFALSRFEAVKGRIVAEKKAEQSESHFMEIFMSAPVPMLILNKENDKVRRMNNAFIDWSGYLEQEVLKQDQWLQQFLGEGYALLHTKHTTLHSTESHKPIHTKEFDVLTKYQNHRTVLFSSLSIGSETIISFTDITNIRLQEKELIQKEEAFRQIIEQPNIGIYVRDQDKFLYTNKKFCDIVGCTSEQLKNKGMADLILNDPATQAFVKEQWTAIYPTGAKHEYQIPFERKDGQQLVLNFNATPIMQNGKPAVLVFVQDITIADQAQRQTQYYIQKLEHAIKGTFQAVSNMIELRDPYTSGHERRVGVIAKRIAEELGLPENHCRAIELTGLVHDIGKIAIPAEILSKPGRLSDMELQLVKGHAEAGYNILKDVEFDFPVAEIIWQHHERLDGSGYPRGLKGDEILLETRIVSVADVIEAMSSDRPYRVGLGLNIAMEEIKKGRGKIYDPIVVDALFKIIHENNNKLPV